MDFWHVFRVLSLGKIAIVRGPTALIEDLKNSKNRDRVKFALIETALIGDSLYSFLKNFPKKGKTDLFLVNLDI